MDIEEKGAKKKKGEGGSHGLTVYRAEEEGTVLELQPLIHFVYLYVPLCFMSCGPFLFVFWGGDISFGWHDHVSWLGVVLVILMVYLPCNMKYQNVTGILLVHSKYQIS